MQKLMRLLLEKPHSQLFCMLKNASLDAFEISIQSDTNLDHRIYNANKLIKFLLFGLKGIILM